MLLVLTFIISFMIPCHPTTRPQCLVPIPNHPTTWEDLVVGWTFSNVITVCRSWTEWNGQCYALVMVPLQNKAVHLGRTGLLRPTSHIFYVSFRLHYHMRYLRNVSYQITSAENNIGLKRRFSDSFSCLVST